MSEINENIPLEFTDVSTAGPPERTILQAFESTVAKYKSNDLLHYKKGDTWATYTVEETYNECLSFGKALVTLGIKKGNAVNIIGFNSTEWFFAAVGTVMAGGVAAGIYATNNVDMCEYIADHSEALVVVCDGVKQLEKYTHKSDKFATIKAIVVYNLAEIPESMKADIEIPIYTFSDFLDVGKDIETSTLTKGFAEMTPKDVCTLIYTSGTTGKPKAVMLSHDNITFAVDTVVGDIQDVSNTDVMVSYLPLSHIAAQMLDIYAPIYTGLQIFFAQPDALRGSLGTTLKEAKPTIFFAVPRVYEKMMEKMLHAGRNIKGVQKRIADWAKCKGLQKSKLGEYGKSGGVPCGHGCANALILSRVRAALGFAKTRMFITAAAPISVDVIEYFASFDIQIYELYGLSESSGPMTYNLNGKWKIGTVGKAMASLDVKIAPEAGEILCKGRNVMIGYLKNEAATKESIDADGYLRTGDIGSIDEDGFLSITGRIKELIIGAGGENIGPGIIEENIRESTAGLANVMLVGDKKKYLVVLYTFATELNDDGSLTDKLDANTVQKGKDIGSSATTIKELQECSAWKEYLTKGLKKANEKAPSRACVVQKYAILERDFSIVTGELTPTLKLRRAVVAKKYHQLIEDLYKEEKPAK